MNKSDPADTLTPAEHLTQTIAGLTDWRGPLLARLRSLIHEAAPGVVEEWKWETPVYSLKGQVCATGVFKDHVKINFFKGASLADPDHLFNAGLDAKATRAIDYNEGDPLNEAALKSLLRAAAALNEKK